MLAKAGLHFTDFKLCYNGSDDIGWYSSIDFNYSVDFKCAIDLEGEVEIPIVEIFVPQLELVGIHLDIAVSLTINGSVSASMNITISGGYHFFWDRENGRRFNCDYNGTKFSSELSGEFEKGLKFAAKFSLLYKVIDVELSANPTLTVSVTSGGKKHNEENHLCDNCIYGNLTGRIKLGIEASVIFGLIGYSNDWTVAEIRLLDYHWSDNESQHTSCKDKARIGNFVFDTCPFMSYEISIMPYASSNFSSDYDSITPDDNIPAPEIYYYENPDNEDTHSEIYTLLDHSIAEANDDGFYVFKEVAKPETMYVPDIQYNGLRNEYEWIYFKKTNFGLFEFLKELWVDNELEKKQFFDQSDLENGEIVNYPVLVVESNGIQEISFKNQNGDPIREYSGISTITDANGEVKIKVQYEKELGRDYIISATIDNGKQSDLMTINPDIVRVDSTTVKNGKVTVAIDGTSTKIIMLTKEGEAPDISGQRITDIAAGYSHSAAITED